jgi:hypothetical protein
VSIGAVGWSAEAANLTVNCDKKETIRGSLKLLAMAHPQGPNTQSVGRNCVENASSALRENKEITLPARSNVPGRPMSGRLALHAARKQGAR